MTQLEQSLDGLLCSILSNPDDDTPRLLYADCLDDIANGQTERAEFIRLQVELARLRSAPHWHEECDKESLCPCDRLQARCDELLLGWRDDHSSIHNWHAWMGPVWDVLPNESGLGTDVTFHRGFIDAITCSWEDCAAHLDSILKAQPVTKVTLTTYPRQGLGVVAIDSAGWLDLMNSRSIDENVLSQLAVQWPGVEFTLPQGRTSREATLEAALEHGDH